MHLQYRTKNTSAWKVKNMLQHMPKQRFWAPVTVVALTTA